MRSKSSSKAANRNSSRAATPNIIGAYSSGPTPNWTPAPTAEWLGEYGRQIDNLRTALDWTFSSGGDAEIGVALTAAAAPLWLLLSLLEECRDRVERALAALKTVVNGDARREMKLNAVLGASLVNGADTTLPAMGGGLDQGAGDRREA